MAVPCIILCKVVRFTSIIHVEGFMKFSLRFSMLVKHFGSNFLKSVAHLSIMMLSLVLGDIFAPICQDIDKFNVLKLDRNFWFAMCLVFK